VPDQVKSPDTQAKNPKDEGHLSPQSGLNEEDNLKDGQESQKDVGAVSEQHCKRLDAGFDVVRTILLQSSLEGD